MTIVSAATLRTDQELDCDVCIIGSGAGGAVLAAGLVERGLDVIVLEAGGHYTREDFAGGRETWAYDHLYQDRGSRATEDVAITVLQGRSVGGGTTINWTTCYRTPERILEHWRTVHGVQGLDLAALEPHWEAVERRLNIHEWPEEAANPNNQVLLRGGRALGWHPHALRRNVRGCVNSGYCGVGCPVDGKQGMAVSYLDDAVRGGLRLFANCEARELVWSESKVSAVEAQALDPETDEPTGVRLTIRPKVVVSAGGAINGPTLLLRSGIDGGGRVGKRTFIHPVCGVAGLYDDLVVPWHGAPQSVGCHEFVDRGPGRMGFFLESAPLQPMLASTVGFLFGQEHASFMGKLGHIGVVIALGIDGLLPEDVGGEVILKSDGRSWLRYPFREPLIEYLRASHIEMARCQLAAGATEVATLHAEPVSLTSEAHLDRLQNAPYGPHEQSMFTAHAMGGCAMGGAAETSVVDSDLKVWGFDNLFVVDGSVFPTSLGVNPSLSIYGVARRARDAVAAAV